MMSWHGTAQHSTPDMDSTSPRQHDEGDVHLYSLINTAHTPCPRPKAPQQDLPIALKPLKFPSQASKAQKNFRKLAPPQPPPPTPPRLESFSPPDLHYPCGIPLPRECPKGSGRAAQEWAYWVYLLEKGSTLAPPPLPSPSHNELRRRLQGEAY